MGHESAAFTGSFPVVFFEQDDLRRKHDLFGAARWEALGISMTGHCGQQPHGSGSARPSSSSNTGLDTISSPQ